MRLLLLPFCFLFCTTITLQAQELVPRGGEYFCRDAEDWYNRKAITTYLRHIYVGEPEKVLPLADAREGDVEIAKCADAVDCVDKEIGGDGVGGLVWVRTHDHRAREIRGGRFGLEFVDIRHGCIVSHRTRQGQPGRRIAR